MGRHGGNACRCGAAHDASEHGAMNPLIEEHFDFNGTAGDYCFLPQAFLFGRKRMRISGRGAVFISEGMLLNRK